MKRIIITITISLLAIFNTGCEALTDLLPSGCMLKDSPNYDSSAVLPCNDEGTANDCCEDITYGCTDSDSPDYVGDDQVDHVTACSDCDDDNTAENCCCGAAVSGCTDCGANNYDVTATDDDGSCTYDTAGCIDPDACCNIADHASKDCSNVSGGDDNSCCSSVVYTTCYLDLNNNGYYEESQTSASGTCDCGDFGPGWVNENYVVVGSPEVMGCTNSTLQGDEIDLDGTSDDETYICGEYGHSGDNGDEYANVDDGSCCMDDPQAMSDLSEGDAAYFLGEYNVVVQVGNVIGNECVYDQALTEDWYGHDGEENASRTQTINLGYDGTFQYYESKTETFSDRPQWEYQDAGATTVNSCQEAGNDANYWYCDNWGHDYQNCEDFSYQGECPGDRCRWETNFCHPDFQGQPCHNIHMENECWDNGCQWDAFDDQGNGNCYQPAHIPGDQCWGMNEEDCVYDNECIVGTDFVDCSMCDCDTTDACVNDCCGEEDGPPECIMDCEFPDAGLDTDSGFELCKWITTTLIIGGAIQECMDDCDTEFDDNGENMSQQIEELAGECELCLAAGDNAEEVCNYMWDDMDGDGGDCDGCDCSGNELDCWACAGGDCCNDSECADGETGDDGPDDCLVKNMVTGAPDECPGMEDLGGNATGTEICTFFTGLVVDGVVDECIMDCDYATYMDFFWAAYFCVDCLDNDDCDSTFGNGFVFDLQVSLPDALALQLSKMQGAQNHGNYLSRSDECSFDDGFLDDCSGDGDCCPREWVGDNYGDCQDQAFGCDLSCYSDSEGNTCEGDLCPNGGDGGDCQEGFANMECMPNDNCWYIHDDVECAFSNCFWNFDNDFCHPHPDHSGGSDCGEILNDFQCGQEDMCHWVDEFPADAEFTNPHCAPAPMEDANCHNYNNRSSCDDSGMCHWDAPDWMEDWQDGVCMSFNPCAIPENNNPDTCSAEDGCDWNWEYNECYKL